MRAILTLSTLALTVGAIAQLADDAMLAGMTAQGARNKAADAHRAEVNAATYAPIDDAALYARATDRMERGDASGALHDLDHVLERRPLDVEALMLHSKAQQLMGERQLAKTDLHRVLGIEAKGTNMESALFELGRMAMDDRDLPTALAHYDHLVVIASDNAQAWCAHGKALSVIRDDDRAITDLEKAIYLDPELDEAYAELAMIYFRQGRKQEGEYMLQHAQNLHDRSFEELMMVNFTR